MLSMGITTDHSDISCVMSLWAIFHPLGHPSMIVADHTTSTPWFTPRYYKHSFKNNIKSVADIVGILCLSSLRCLFLTYAADLGLASVQPSNTASAIQSRHDDGISLWNDAYTLYDSWGYGVWSLNLRIWLIIYIVMVEMLHWPSRQMPNI